MKLKKIREICFLVATIFLTLFFTSCKAEWFTDLEAAKIVATEKNKNILIFFCSSDSDEVSKAFISDIFTSKEFISKVASKYVLVKVNFPQGEEIPDEEQYSINFSLIQDYSVTQIPSVYLVTAEGYTFETIPSNIVPDSASEYTKLITDLNKKSSKLASLSKKLKKTEGLEKVKLLDQYISEINSEYRYALLDLIQEIETLDPNNTTGVIDKYAMIQGYAQAMTAVSLGDYKSAIGILKAIAEQDSTPAKDKQEAYYTASYIVAITDPTDLEGCFELMQKAYDADPTSDIAPSILSSIDYAKTFTAEQQTSEEEEIDE